MPRPPNALRTTHVGEWSWNEQLFHSKYECDPATGCHIWHGATTHNGPLFGVNKNSKPRMTQATRIAWMSHYRETIEQEQLIHTCREKNCINPQHLKKMPAQRHGNKVNEVVNRPLSTHRKLHAKTPNQWMLVFSLDPECDPVNKEFKRLMSQEIASHEIARHGIDFEMGYSWITVSQEHALKLTLKYPAYSHYMRAV